MLTGPHNFHNKFRFIMTVLFSFFTLWFVFIVVYRVNADGGSAQIWSATYQLIAWVGAIYGIYFSRLWGGWHSVIGRANLVFALGLLAQSFGQSIFSYYFYTGIEAPYPSIADLGFFGSIPLYIYGVILIARVSGAYIRYKTLSNKIFVFLVTVLALIMSYSVFLRSYEFYWDNPLTIFLDFGYPIGQAIYISLAVIAYVNFRGLLGGTMRKSIMLIIFALVAQYLSDYVFLYQISRGIYEGVNTVLVDYLYLVAYFVMSLALINLGHSFTKIRDGNQTINSGEKPL